MYFPRQIFLVLLVTLFGLNLSSQSDGRNQKVLFENYQFNTDQFKDTIISLRKQSRLDEALIKLENILNNPRFQGNSELLGFAEISYGKILQTQAKFQEAIPHYIKAIDKYVSPSELKDYNDTYYRVIFCSYQIGDLEVSDSMALKYLRQPDSTLYKDHWVTLNTMIIYATILKKKGEYKRAVDIFNRALDFEEGVELKKEQRTMILTNLSQLYLTIKDFKNGITYLLKARELYERYDDTLGVILSDLNLCNAQLHLKNYEDVEKTLSSINAEYLEKKDLNLFLSYLIYQGELNGYQGAFEKAKEYYEKAESYSTEAPFKSKIGWLEKSYASILAFEGNYNLAIEKIKEAISYYKESGPFDTYFEYKTLLGQFYFNNNQFEKVDSIIQQLEKDSDTLSLKLLYINVLELKRNFAEKNGDLPLALELFKQEKDLKLAYQTDNFQTDFWTSFYNHKIDKMENELSDLKEKEGLNGEIFSKGLTILAVLVLVVLIFLLFNPKGNNPFNRSKSNAKIRSFVDNENVKRNLQVAHKGESPSGDDTGNGFEEFFTASKSAISGSSKLPDDIVEQLSKINELKNFAFSIAHDIKHPVSELKNIIQKFQSEEKEGKEDEAQRLAQMKTILDSLENYIQKSMEVKKMESIPLKKNSFEVDELLSDVLDDFPDQKVIFQKDNLGKIYGDVFLIRKVFQNLYHNSIKALKDHPNPIIKINQENLPDKIILRWHDNAFENKEFNFEKGSGFGLDIIKMVMSKHGGHLKIETDRESGSRVSILEFPHSS